jgi:hypothetical protein
VGSRGDRFGTLGEHYFEPKNSFLGRIRAKDVFYENQSVGRVSERSALTPFANNDRVSIGAFSAKGYRLVPVEIEKKMFFMRFPSSNERFTTFHDPRVQSTNFVLDITLSSFDKNGHEPHGLDIVKRDYDLGRLSIVNIANNHKISKSRPRVILSSWMMPS